MHYLFICLFFISIFPLNSVQSSKQLTSLAEKTSNDPFLNNYIANFPSQEYEIVKVPMLGSFYIDRISDGIKQHLRKGIYWESTIGILIRLFAQPNTVVVDLGAHIGIHTLVMSKKVGPKGLVIAFEPQYKIFRELYYNLRLNQANDNVIALRNAVGQSEGHCELSVRDPTNEGGTSIGRGGDSTYMVTLDSLKLTNVSLIKIDVESYEIEVLHGAEQTLLKNKPVVIFEILGNVDLDHCSGENKAKYDYVLSYLTSLDYSVQRIWGNDFIAFPQDFFNR